MAENKKTKNTIKLIVDILLWVFLAFSIVTTVFAFISRAGGKDYPVINGKCWLYVRSDSMEGSEGFSKGDLIIGKVLTDSEKSRLKEGDVITFYHDLDDDGVKELNTHRIIRVNADGSFKTKGDNNQIEDSYVVYASDIEAVWTGKHYAGLGAVLGFLSSSTGFLVCVVIPLGLFFVYQIVALIMMISGMKAKKEPNISKEDEERIKELAIKEFLAKQALKQERNDDEND